MNTNMVRVTLAMVALMLALPVSALQAVNISPVSVNVGVRVGIPPIAINPLLLPPRPTFRDLFQGRSPAVSLSPSSLSIVWRPVCVAENAPATSPRGEFRTNGTVLATNNRLLSTGGVGCNGTIPVAETITIPNTVVGLIVETILDTRVPIAVDDFSPRRLEDAMQRVAANAVPNLTYQRRWQAPASSTGAKTASLVVSLVARVAGRFQLESSRLVSFTGTSPSRGLSVLRTSAPVTATWIGTVEQDGAGSALSLRSDGVIIKSRSGAVIGRNSRPLTRVGIRSGRAVFNETINLTSTQLLRARQAGGGMILERTLSDDVGNSFVARIQLNLSGPSQAKFAVTGIKCRFHDGARVKVLQEGDTVQVVCDLRFDGPGGLLRGTWEIADGDGSRLFFRPLQLYSNLVVGQNRVQVTRVFRATGAGRHIIRFKVQQPELTTDQPEIQYYVGISPDEINPSMLPQPLWVSKPVPDSGTEAGLEVSWEVVPDGATHVLVEFFTPDRLTDEPNPNEREQRNSSLLVRGEPIAGLVVPADRNSAQISHLVMEHLHGSGHIYMRVSALQDGILVAVSPLRSLFAR